MTASCPTCPLMTAVLPLRYAVSPVPYQGALLDGLTLPELPDTFPHLGNRYHRLQGRALGYAPRLLRDGWLYLWLEGEARLVEYQVLDGLLKETNRGGPAIDTRRLHYLQVPAGETMALAWTPNPWSDEHFRSLTEDEQQRSLHMRVSTPGNSPNANLLSDSTFHELPEVQESEGFDWSGPMPVVPYWRALERATRRLDQRAMAVVDDPWGVIQDLATLIRTNHQGQEELRARYGGEWALANVIRELRDSDDQLRRKLPELTDSEALYSTWRQSDESEGHYEESITSLVDSWARWLETLNCEGVGSLHSACESVDLAKESSRYILEYQFALTLTGPSMFSKGAAAIGRIMAGEGGGNYWLWYMMLGLKEKLSPGEIEKITILADVAVSVGESVTRQAAAFSASINAIVARLSAYSLAKAGEDLFAALGPVAAAGLSKLPGDVGKLGASFLAAMLARTGQELEVEEVPRIRANQWMSEAAGTARPGSAIAGAVSETTTTTAVFRLKAANDAVIRGNPYTVEDAVFKVAKVRSLIVFVAGINLAFSANKAFHEFSLKDSAKGIGAFAGASTAIASVGHKLAELNWQEARSLAENPEALSHGWGMGVSFAAAVTSSFDILIYGIEAFESFKQGDFDTAVLEVGLVGLSSGQLSLAVYAFRAYRAARAAALLGEAEAAAAALGRLGGPYAALSITLLVAVIGGLALRFFLENTPLEDWLANTRFGVMPAEWAGDYPSEMLQLYKVVFPVRMALSKVPELNPYTVEHVAPLTLFLYLPGQKALHDSMVHFEGDELLDGLTYRTLAWTEETIRDLFTDEERAVWFNRNKRPVILSGNDFSRHEGTRIQNPVGTAVYRKIYDKSDEIKGLEGQLTYQPQPGLFLLPIPINLLAVNL